MIIRLLLALGLMSSAAGTLKAETCPKPLETAVRLVVVTTASMDAKAATLRLYTRKGVAARWMAEGEGLAAVVGRSGLAWGHGFAGLAQPGERTKVEGDHRTPAGVFPIGATFGFASQSYPGHIVLKTKETICVDDPGSPHYNQIVKRLDAGKVASAEDMAGIALYRKGVVVDYASDRSTRAGSCIFLHVWRSAHEGTTGCVAMPETLVERLQAFTREPSALVVLAKSAMPRLQACLPGVEATPHH